MAERWQKVAVAPNETSALLMDGLLKDAGIPSLIQRAPHLRRPGFPVFRFQGRAGAGYGVGRSQAGSRRHHGARLVRAVAAPRQLGDLSEDAAFALGRTARAGTLIVRDLGEIGDHLTQLVTRQLQDAEGRQPEPPPEAERIEVREPRDEQRDDRAMRHHDQMESRPRRRHFDPTDDW